jgi:hypothetical protein
MNHFASRTFWDCYKSLPEEIRELADKNFSLLQSDTSHPSLHFKKIGQFRSARVGRQYRALESKRITDCFGFGLVIIRIMSESLTRSRYKIPLMQRPIGCWRRVSHRDHVGHREYVDELTEASSVQPLEHVVCSVNSVAETNTEEHPVQSLPSF